MNVTVRARTYHNNTPRIVELEIAVPHGYLFEPEELESLMMNDGLDALLTHSLMHDTVAPAQPKMNLAQLDALAPRQRYCKQICTDAPCSICQNTFRTRQYVRNLPCNHMFCGQCISKWITEHSATCPVCRASLTDCTQKDE